MKRKELYEFIREGIIEELSEVGLFTLKNPTDTNKGLAQTIDPDDTTEKSPQFLSKYKKVSESDIEEMARIPNKIRLGDDAKITLAKELYGPETIEGRLIAAIEGSEDGLTQKELGAALGITIDSKLNPLIQKLAFAQVLAKPAKTATAEPEPIVEPETDEELPTLDPDEEPVDDYEKPEEEEPELEEPVSDKDIAAAAKGISIVSKVDPKQAEFISKVKEVSQKIKKIKDPVM